MSNNTKQPNTNDQKDDPPNYPGLWPPQPKQAWSHPSLENIPLNQPFGNPNNPAFQYRHLGTPPTAAATTRGFRGETVGMTPTTISQPDERPLAGRAYTERLGSAQGNGSSLLHESRVLQGYGGTSGGYGRTSGGYGRTSGGYGRTSGGYGRTSGGYGSSSNQGTKSQTGRSGGENNGKNGLGQGAKK